MPPVCSVLVTCFVLKAHWFSGSPLAYRDKRSLLATNMNDIGFWVVSQLLVCSWAGFVCGIHWNSSPSFSPLSLFFPLFLIPFCLFLSSLPLKNKNKKQKQDNLFLLLTFMLCQLVRRGLNSFIRTLSPTFKISSYNRLDMEIVHEYLLIPSKDLEVFWFCFWNDKFILDIPLGHLILTTEVCDFHKLPVGFMGVRRAGFISKTLYQPA